jgi:P27 family predicted phage terminase small subunit
MRGRKPIPSALKALRGSLTPGIEPTPAAGAPTEPDIVANNPIAHAEWERVCAVLDDMGLLAISDYSIIMLYCCAHADWMKASEMVARYGEVMYADAGKKVLQVSPYASARNNAEKRIAKYLGDMGLNATARARLRVSPKPKQQQNVWQGLIN